MKFDRLTNDRHHVFEPSAEFVSDLQVSEQLVEVTKGSRRATIDVTNTTKGQMKIPAGALIGNLEAVASCIPLPVETRINYKRDDDSSGAKQEGVPETFVPQVPLDSSLSEQQRKKIEKMLHLNCDAFAKDDSELGDFRELEMTIKLTDETPVRLAYNSIPRPLYEEVRAHITDMINRRIVRPSTSNYCSPLVVVRKKNGKLRICTDFRAINSKTVPENNPIPKVQDIVDSLSGMTYFSTLDMKEAYHQGYVHPNSRHYTAFTCPLGLYEYIRIPYGLRNAVPNFQRSIEKCLGDLRHRICAPYVDDTLIYSKTFDDHLQDVTAVLQRIRKNGIKLNASKCELFRKQVTYLGRSVSSEGYKMDPSNIAAVAALKDLGPRTVGEVRRLLGLLSYYRRYVKNFAKIVYPVNQLLKVANGGEKTKKGQAASRQHVEWTTECQLAAERVIDVITSEPMMAYPNFELPFVVHTDASSAGLGAVLYQKQGTVMKVIGYASRTLLPAERNYHSSKLEFLCMKWAVCEHFRNYLFYAKHFTVITDNNPLLYCMTSAKLNATTVRWVNDLSEFNFNIKYRPGRIHHDADTLSRHPLPIESYMEQCSKTVDMADVDTLLETGLHLSRDIPLTSTFMNPANIQLLETRVFDEQPISLDEFRREQQKNDDIRCVVELVRNGTKPTNAVTRNGSREFRGLLRSFSKFIVKDGILYRQNEVAMCIVIPPKYRNMVYHELHTKLGHVGSDRVYQLARERFYWLNMESDIRHFVSHQCKCVGDKHPVRQTRAPLQSINSSCPLELVSVDFLELEKSGGYRYLLVIVDHFTRYTEVYLNQNRSAKTAEDKLYNQFVLRYGYPA